VFSREEANAKVIVFDLTTGYTTLEVSTLSEFGCSLMQRFQIIVIASSLLNTQQKGVRAKTGWR
jgi:hypothetical protein